jgi:hypothetical protein
MGNILDMNKQKKKIMHQHEAFCRAGYEALEI